MSHGVINETSSASRTAVRTAQYWNSLTCYTSGPTYYATYPSSPPATYKYRSASKHTVKDAYGWRMPQPYKAITITTSCGMYDTTAMNKGCLDNFSPPAAYHHPISALSTSVFLYRYSLGKTPLTRAYGIPLANLRAWDKARCVSKFNASDFSLGVTLGETRETYRMVIGALRDIRTFLRMVKQGALSGPKLRQLFRKYDPFSVYLQWRYGWSQLYRDIWNGVKLIEDLDDGTYKRYRLFAKSKTSYHTSTPRSRYITTAIYDGYRWYLGKEACKTRIDMFLNNQDYVYLDALGLQPLPTAWELLPWSFVMDWFLNIGTFLEAWTTKEGWTFLSGSQSVVGEYTEFAQILNGYAGYEVTCPPLTNELFQFERTVLSNPNPTLAVNPQLLNGMVSNLRIADAVSLLAQQLKRF